MVVGSSALRLLTLSHFDTEVVQLPSSMMAGLLRLSSSRRRSLAELSCFGVFVLHMIRDADDVVQTSVSASVTTRKEKLKQFNPPLSNVPRTTSTN